MRIEKPITQTLTLLITCPCGYHDEITGVHAGDIAHAKFCARSQGWVNPRINNGPLDGNNRMTGRGQCEECRQLTLNGYGP